MNQLLDQAVEAVRELPSDEQDEIARMMLALAGKEAPETIDASHLPSVQRGLEQARRNDYASEAEVAAAFSRFRP